jgi:hypothetical protein
MVGIYSSTYPSRGLFYAKSRLVKNMSIIIVVDKPLWPSNPRIVLIYTCLLLISELQRNDEKSLLIPVKPTLFLFSCHLNKMSSIFEALQIFNQLMAGNFESCTNFMNFFYKDLINQNNKEGKKRDLKMKIDGLLFRIHISVNVNSG